VSIEHIVEEV